MCDLQTLVIGSEASDHLKIAVLRRKYPDTNDYWDGNWLDCDMSVSVGGFSGNVNAALRTDEIKRFHDELIPLYESLGGSAEFVSLELWLTIRINGDKLGHFTANCELRDDQSFPNRLLFDLAFDQTELPAMLHQLSSILETFPVIGDQGESQPVRN
jgi:hypothetical protein